MRERNEGDANGKVAIKEAHPPVSYAYCSWAAGLDAGAGREILSGTSSTHSL